MARQKIEQVGVLGAGLMGHGIAQVAAQSGYEVVLREVDDATLQKGLAKIEKQLARAVEKGKSSLQDADALRAVHGEGDAGVRQADCCNTCRGYLKAIAVLDPLDYVSLLTTDLETAGLDLVAVDRGYTRGSARSGCLGATRSR